MLDVDASWNSIGDAGCKALSDFLREIGQPVQSLKMLNNHIGSDGASALACLVNKVAVHELHLSHNRIGPDGMVRILKSLAVDASCFRVGTCRCSGSELVQTMEVAWGSGLAARAQKAAALLAKRGALGRVPGRWDVGVCIAAFGLVACLGVCVSQHSASSPPSDCESRHSAHLPTRILGHILGAQGSCDRSRPRSLSGLTFNARRKTAAH